MSPHFGFDFWSRIAMSPDGDGGGAASTPAPVDGGGAPSGDTTGGPSDATGGDLSSDFVITDDVMFSEDLDTLSPQPGETRPEGQEATPPKAPEAAKVPDEKKPAAGAKPPAQAEAQKKPEPPKAPVAPQKPQAQATPPTTSARPSAPLSNQELLAEVAKNRDSLIKGLAENRFKLTEEEGKLLDTDANAGLATIAARVYYEATSSMLALMDKFQREILPQAIEQHQSSTKVYSEAEDAFYSEWPNLDRKDQEVARSVQVYANLVARAHPNFSRDERIKMVGNMVSSALNRPKVQAPPSPPARPNGGTRPFTPASGGGRPPMQHTRQETTDTWAGMGQEFGD